MTRTLNEVMQSLPLDQQEEIEAQAAQLIKEEKAKAASSLPSAALELAARCKRVNSP